MAAVLAVAGCSSTPATPVESTGPSRPTHRLVFDDEFSGSAVDRSKWNVRNDSYSSNEESIVTSRAENVAVADGHLTITARREYYRADNTARDYTSGYLDTIGRWSQRYGRWEMRAKLPAAQGMWPAFWLRADDSAAEVDIMEAVGGLPRMALQTVYPSTDDGSVKRSHIATVQDGTTSWHVYGFTWTPTAMTWDIDGRTVFTVRSRDIPWLTSAFTRPMNIRLNLQVGGALPRYYKRSVTSASKLPAQYQIDWVRAYSA